MKCKNCNANLQIEDEKCPFCGAENPFAKQHRADMKKYAGEFNSTRKEVLENSSRFNRYTVKITITAVLVALCACALILVMNTYQVKEYLQERKIAAHKTEHIQKVTELLDNGDYIAASYYINAQKINYAKPLDEYYSLFTVTRYYSYIVEQINYIIGWDKQANHYEDIDAVFSRLSEYIGYIYYESTPRKYAKDGSYTDDKLAYMTAEIADMNILLKTYIGLTDEDTSELKDLSDVKRTILLTERYEALKNDKQ